ncbi:MAG: glycerophosphodiester phosphodiesterase family protein [Planctomycetota bacterium]|jgi:glycerophosphoryl diester phosphodiesterase
MAPWKRSLGRIRTAFLRLLVFDLLFRAASVLLLTPLAALTLDALLSSSGSAAVTNADIPSFVLSPGGAVFAVLGASLVFAGLFAEQAGLMLVLAHPGRGQSAVAALRQVLLALPRLLIVAAAQLAWLALVVAPALVVAAIVYATTLSAHDINWYLATHPPEWTRAILIVAAAGVPTVAVLALLVVRWSFAIPVCLLERRTGFAALRRSTELVRGRTRTVARLLLGWIACALLLSAILVAAFDAGAEALLSFFSSPESLVVPILLLIGLLLVGGAVVFLAAFSGFAALTLELYDERAGPRPASAPETATLAPRLGWAALVVAAVVSVIAGLKVGRAVEADLKRSRQVLVTAHRGSSAKAPENSLAALRAALADDADFAEIDVQQLRDKTIVLVHDTDFKRITGHDLRVWETDYGDLADLDSGSWFAPEFKAERVPTLRQAIELVKGRMRLNIELKYHGHERGFEEDVVALLRETGFKKHCVLTSLEARGLRRVRTLAPDLKVGQIVTVALGTVERLDTDFLSMAAKAATPAQVRRNRAAGLGTHVWTVNTRDGMERMIERGVDNLITDEPELARRVIDERAALPDAALLVLALGRTLRE